MRGELLNSANILMSEHTRRILKIFLKHYLLPCISITSMSIFIYEFQGYSRLGTAFSFLKQYEEAEKTFEAGLKLEPNNAQLKAGLEEVQSNLAATTMGNPFKNPNLYALLHANPKTREYLNQPDFVQMLEQLKQNPKALNR